MFRCVLCLALCLVSAPLYAANMEITEDTVIDFSTPGMEFIHVRGDATLTVRGDLNVRVVSSIKLFDTASLVLEGGRIEKSIWFLGSGNQADFTGGRFSEQFAGSGSGVVNIDGDTQLRARFAFTGGSQEINLRSFYGDGYQPTVDSTVDGLVNVYSDDPRYGRTGAGCVPAGLTSGGTAICGIISILDDTPFLIHQSDQRPNGDTNGDFKVDISDLNNARNYFGASDYRGDTFPMDGIVNINDLNTIRNSFGATSQPQAVPEPSSIAMALGCIALSYTLGRCRYSR